ncbi:hypothetical protein LCGC14_2608520 [marine sediment metagenome]|uniref:Homing endonuclease LAGLIDADG domain-containing protein n=1 Tax=marine sediment metagenome TaxID=412755 RepID=A0A0F9CHN8_9ZZZZ
MPQGNEYNHKLPDINILKTLYFGDKMSAEEIARKYNVTKGAVFIKFRRYNIQRRSLEEAQSIKANYIKLTLPLIHFMDGLLLGDGSVTLAPRGKSATYSHTDKHKEYLRWLRDKFENYRIECANIRGHTNDTYAIRTKHYRDFVYFRQRWYPNNKKKIPPTLELNPTVLFNWFIGDGSYIKGNKVFIATQFDVEGRTRIARNLEKIGIDNSIYNPGIYIKADSRTEFFRYILSSGLEIPTSYQYKFPRDLIYARKFHHDIYTNFLNTNGGKSC